MVSADDRPSVRKFDLWKLNLAFPAVLRNYPQGMGRPGVVSDECQAPFSLLDPVREQAIITRYGGRIWVCYEVVSGPVNRRIGLIYHFERKRFCLMYQMYGTRNFTFFFM